MVDLKKYNMGTILAISLSFLIAIFYFTPFLYNGLIGSQISGYEMFLLMFEPTKATGVGASLFNVYTEVGMQFSPLAYIVTILSFLLFIVAIAIIIFGFVDMMGYRGNKKIVTYLCYSMVGIVALIMFLAMLRAETASNVNNGIEIGYGLILSLIASVFLSLLRYLKIK